jgi:hypothetical protein
MSSTENSLDTTAPVIEKKSRWEDYIDVFFSPTELFERRKDDSVWPPLITLLILATAFYFMLLPAQEIIKRAMMPPEMQAKLASMASIMAIISGIMVPIATGIGLAITAGILWLLAKLVDADPSFKEMMIVATYAGFIGLIGGVASQVAILIHGEAGIDIMRHSSFGVMRFLDSKTLPHALPGLLMRLDIFKIWQAVVWAIGFRVVTGVSKQKAAIVAGATWLLFAVPGILGGNAASKMGNMQIKAE